MFPLKYPCGFSSSEIHTTTYTFSIASGNSTISQSSALQIIYKTVNIQYMSFPSHKIIKIKVAHRTSENTLPVSLYICPASIPTRYICHRSSSSVNTTSNSLPQKAATSNVPGHFVNKTLICKTFVLYGTMASR